MAMTMQTVQDIALVFSLSVVIYLNVLKGEFVFDDLVAIVDNKDVKPDQPWEKVFEHDFWGQKMDDWQSHKSFRPLTILSFRLSYILSGQRWDEVHFHLTNVLLHGLVSVLVLPVTYRCFGASRRFAAVSSALFFATHPIHTDAVSSIVSRGEQLSALLLLLSFLAYSLAANPTRGLLSTLFWVPLSLFLAFIGMLCKEQAITVVAIQAAYDVAAVSPALRWFRSLVSGYPKREAAEASQEDGAHGPDPDGMDVRGSEDDEKEEEEEDGDDDDERKEAESRKRNVGRGSEQDRSSAEELSLSSSSAQERSSDKAARASLSVHQSALLLLRLAILAVGFVYIYAWRMEKNGACVTVYKTKGDPLISAWDAAGTVAPGIYSESACKPNFLQVENPARFARGPTAELTKAMTWNYLAAYNAYLLFNPSILRADYSHGTIPVIETQQDLRNLATAIFWLGLIALGLVGIVKASLHPPDPAILLSIAFLVVPFIPSSNLFFPVGFVVAERVLYMPSLGFCMLLALLLERLDHLPTQLEPHHHHHHHHHHSDRTEAGDKLDQKSGSNVDDGAVKRWDQHIADWPVRRKIARGAVVLIVGLYAVRTWVRNYDWVSREGFYGAMVRDNPTNPKAHYGYGNIIINDVKRVEIGEKHLLEASRLQPNYFDAYNDLGAWYNRNGQYEKAKKMFEWAVKAKPEHINGLANQGLNFLNMQDWENAFLVFDKAVEFFPDSVDFYNNMGMALQGLQMPEDALQAYSDIIVLDPVNPRSYYLYAIAAGQLGRTEEAEMYFRNAIRIRPWYIDALYNLGVCLMKQERMEEAYAYFLRVNYVNHNHPGLKQYMDILRGL